MRCIRHAASEAASEAASVAAILALSAAAVDNAGAQTGPPPAYRPPTLVVAAPAEGTPLPEDKPVVVLRFASVEPADPIDALSFSVAVDGRNRTALFQATQGEAWGPLMAPDETLAPGEHELSARVCTSHGACSTVKATVIVASAPGLQDVGAKAEASHKKSRILDALIQAIRALFR